MTDDGPDLISNQRDPELVAESGAAYLQIFSELLRYPEVLSFRKQAPSLLQRNAMDISQGSGEIIERIDFLRQSRS